MNPVYRTFGFVGVALIVAIASFQDTVALTIGRVGIIMAAVAFGGVLLGAGLSLVAKSNRPREVSDIAVGETHNAETSQTVR